SCRLPRGGARPPGTLGRPPSAPPAERRAPPAPPLPTRWQPSPTRPRPPGPTSGLSREATDTNTRPASGSGSAALAPIWLLANASGNVSSIPITSPVERISGPKMMSTPWNLLNGNTLSLTDNWPRTTSPPAPPPPRPRPLPPPPPPGGRGARPPGGLGTTRPRRPAPGVPPRHVAPRPPPPGRRRPAVEHGAGDGELDVHQPLDGKLPGHR